MLQIHCKRTKMAGLNKSLTKEDKPIFLPNMFSPFFYYSKFSIERQKRHFQSLLEEVARNRLVFLLLPLSDSSVGSLSLPLQLERRTGSPIPMTIYSTALRGREKKQIKKDRLSMTILFIILTPAHTCSRLFPNCVSRRVTSLNIYRRTLQYQARDSPRTALFL